MGGRGFGGEQSEQFRAAGPDDLAMPDELGGVSGELAGIAVGFEQKIPGTKGAFVGAQGFEISRHELAGPEVEKATPPFTPAAHKLDVVVAHPDDEAGLREVISGFPDGSPVHGHAAAFAENHPQATIGKIPFDGRGRFPGFHQFPEGGGPGRLQAQEHADRLEQGRFSLGIGTRENTQPARRQRHLDRAEAADMVEAEAGEHGANKAGFRGSGNRHCRIGGDRNGWHGFRVDSGGWIRQIQPRRFDRRRMIAISIRNLRKSFGESVALHSIDLEIQPGELFFLLGPSGCGKTTLLRHIAGFYEPDSGQILFDGDDVTRVPAHKRDTAMMFQSYALWPHLNVARNVSFGLEERKVAPAEIEERVMEALRIVRMQEYAERRINQLSGGQQQRIALARALVVRPRCLLLDEPLSNLDAKLRLEMRSEIRRICKEFGFTAVYVTHDQKEALSIADRMAVLDGGVIAQVGTPEQIYRRPHTATVSSFIGETNFLTGHVDYVSGDTVLIAGHNGDIEGRISDPSWKPHRGEQVKLSIRPEALILRDDPATKNCLTVRILNCIYLGETAQYELQTRHGEVLRVSELNPGSLREPGDQFRYAHADPKDVVVLRG